MWYNIWESEVVLLKDRKSIYADLSLLMVAFLWGSGFIVTKNALNHMGVYYILFFRFSISTILLGIFAFKNIKNAKAKDIKVGALLGLLLFAVYAFQTVGLQYTEAGKQAFIAATNVVMVPFIVWVIAKVRPHKLDVLSAFLCFIGIGVLSLDSNLSMGFGDILTLFSAMLFGIHITITGYYAKDCAPMVLTVTQYGVASIFTFIFALIFEGTNIYIKPNMIIPILYMSIFLTMIAFLVQTVAQKYTSPSRVAIIISLEAVFGSILAIIFLKEAVTLKLFIGCLTILISVITSETKWEFLKKKTEIEKGI